MKMNGKKKQSGLSIIEFTLVSSALLVVILSVLEFGHYMYSMQVVSDMTRVAARLGVVCSVTDKGDIPGLAIVDNAPADFTAANLEVDYLDSNGGVVTGTLTDDDVFTTIRYVRARVSNYDYQFTGMLSFMGDEGALTIQDYETILPIENLGVHADAGNTDC
ncbi:TadE/TadG family type IV pilus assembly protein [Vibrio profundum]|uniref:TadE/TadG family type IV pilus assembly protein n=1 Tax=Vibrio profundum TaxID=2910247 RepID=UPI003D11FDE1